MAASLRWPTLPSCKQCPASKSCRWAWSKKRSSTTRSISRNPGEARRLANILGVDAVVIGSVTDYTPYYPPRCGMRVEWYAANPGFHEIPPGYGLPWGTPEEEYIPAPLVFEVGVRARQSAARNAIADVRNAAARSAGDAAEAPHDRSFRANAADCRRR